MSYIGRQPTVGNFQICDAISVVNGQAAYTMQVGSVNVVPQSANHMIVSLNGTIQKPNSSFTVSGSTITFASNLATGDVIDFIQILGDVLDLGVPSDATVTTAKLGANSVTAAKLNNDIISGSTELASEPADTDEFLVSDAGTLKRIDYSLIKSSAGAYESQLLHVRDIKIYATSGGSSVSGSQTRDINTVETNEISGASLSSNQITLPAGTYFIQATAPCYKSNSHKAVLHNVTSGAVNAVGTVEYNDSSDNVQTSSFINKRFTISGTSVFEIRHFISVAKSTNGLGIGYNVASTNVYTEVMIWKVA